MTAPTWVRRLWETPWLWIGVLIPLVCVPLFVGLDRTDLDNDEAIYSFAVETMVKNGDWLTPKSIPSETSAFLEKPPLKFWITAAPIKAGLLPDNEFGLRFMDATMGALAFLYVFAIGRKLAGPGCGLAAALLLFTHEALLYQHGLRSNNMESTTVLAYAAGVYHFMAWRDVNPDVKRHVYAMALWFVFAFMTKFVAAAFLPVVLGITALLRREDRARLYRDWKTFVAAAILAVALILPWFIYEYFARGPRLLEIMFGAHVFKRFTAYLDPSHLHPWYYYFTQLWAELAHAGTRTLICIGAALFIARTIAKRWTEGAVVILWFVVPMAAISTGTSKLYHYAYPFLAPVAIVGGWFAATIARRLYLWLARPVAALVSRRDALAPVLRSARVQIALTTAGIVSLIVAAATAGLERLHAIVGGVELRNSSITRPLVATAATWIVGAPAQILQGAAAAALVSLVLPLGAYQSSVAQTKYPHRRIHELRECLRPIVADQVNHGGRAPGVWVEARSISFVPFYYLRDFGQWNQRDTASDETVVKHLLAPSEWRPVILSADRYQDVMTRLSVDRTLVIERAARAAAVEPAALESSLNESAVGLLAFPTETILLPGPYATCGSERVRLVSR